MTFEHNGSASARATACELRRKLRRFAGAVLIAACTGATAWAGQPAASHAQPEGNAEATAAHEGGAEEHGGEHGGLAGLFWPAANFLILAGGIYYFLRAPFSTYLADRSTQIRKDLVEAAALNSTATQQLADVDRKLQALPGELAALRARGAEEIAAEEQRIAAAAVADRDRLLAQAKREIEVRLQTAQRELSDHAATLALSLAKERLEHEISPADHARLVERYVHQVREQ
ncbi:MAG: ATP synthase F0 subunit B [Vicinamibacterales bacterium]